MHIFINGYWKTNLGDDLFLYIISKKFPEGAIRYIYYKEKFFCL